MAGVQLSGTELQQPLKRMQVVVQVLKYLQGEGRGRGEEEGEGGGREGGKGSNIVSTSDSMQHQVVAQWPK